MTTKPGRKEIITMLLLKIILLLVLLDCLSIVRINPDENPAMKRKIKKLVTLWAVFLYGRSNESIPANTTLELNSTINRGKVAKKE